MTVEPDPTQAGEAPQTTATPVRLLLVDDEPSVLAVMRERLPWAPAA